MKAKFSLSLRQRLSASPASSSLRERLLIQTDPLQTDFSVDLTCCAARHAPYCGGLLCRGASCYCASCGRQINPLFLGTFIQPIFFVRPRGRREGLVLHPPPSSSPLLPGRSCPRRRRGGAASCPGPSRRNEILKMKS